MAEWNKKFAQSLSAKNDREVAKADAKAKARLARISQGCTFRYSLAASNEGDF